MNIDLNCDLGEGEPWELTEALMRHITSANIGSERTAQCIELARQHGVHVGAHPRHAGGRADVHVTPDEFEKLLREQVAPFRELHHIKLHGALYHATDVDAALAERYADVVSRDWPGVIIYARCGGLAARIAQERGVEVWGEAFADRRYRADGTLVPRSEPGAVITDLPVVLAHAEEVVRRVRPRTLCVHSDTSGAVAMVQALRRKASEWRLASRE